MSKKLYNRIHCLLLVLLAATFMLPACKKDLNNKPPVITGVRNYAASPNDTVVQTVNTGQWIVVQGNNLSGVTQALFGGIPAAINTTLLTNESIVIQIPSIPFQSVAKDKLHEITVVSESGTATYKINITGPPVISHVRNYDAAPNDTLLDAIAIGQHVNLIGYNLKGATKIAFQGLEIDLSGVVYTDTSVIVNVPSDFTSADASLANKITYTTAIGTSTFFIPIFDPALLAYYSAPLYTLLAGGLNKEKTWMIDFNAQGVSQKFDGPMWFSGHELRWNYGCATSGGNCWSWAPVWQNWMPSPKDYGTMTFKLKGAPIIPSVTVDQKGLDATKNGIFSGGFFMDIDAKTITFSNVVPLNMGWDNVDWSKAYIITLTSDGMQLGFKHKGKNELELYNYIAK